MSLKTIRVTKSELSLALQGPTRVLNGKREVIAIPDDSDKVIVVSSVCPHFGGPLDRKTNSTNELICAWHGWVFDLSSGKCTNRQSNCSLTFYEPQIIQVDEDE